MLKKNGFLDKKSPYKGGKHSNPKDKERNKEFFLQSNLVTEKLDKKGNCQSRNIKVFNAHGNVGVIDHFYGKLGIKWDYENIPDAKEFDEVVIEPIYKLPHMFF